MLNLLMLSLEETLLQLTKSLIHIGKHAAMNMKMCLYYLVPVLLMLLSIFLLSM